ncbi:hypothetical protein ACVIJ6_005385 [Bradyrhizobium sp. USDA 4369]
MAGTPGDLWLNAPCRAADGPVRLRVREER